MDMKLLANQTGLPIKALRLFEKESIVNEDITPEQQYFLVQIVKIFSNTEFIKLQIAKFNTTKRARILFGADLNSIESCILDRWLGHYATRYDKLNLSVKLVVEEVMFFKSLPEKRRPYVIKVAYRMRQKARNMVYRNENGVLVEKAAALTLPQKTRQAKQEKIRKGKGRTSTQFTQNDLFGY